jgi:hypothetical protein
MILGNVIGVALVTPLYLIAVVVVAVLFYGIQRFYKAAALQR